MSRLRLKNRLATDKLMLWGVCLLAALTAVPLFAILGEVLLRGYDQLSWSFFTEPTPTAYKAMKAIEAGEPIPGGIANGIIGTMIMLGMAVVVAVPVGILCGAFLAENGKSRFAQVVSYLTDLLQGTPSVIIGIITYISVLERTKEIGILRSIGASKRDISLVFNAETMIVGLTSGLMGIGLSILLCIPINFIVHYLTDITALSAYLEPAACIILVAISVALTLIAGLIPSGFAAKKDPVEALRTE